MPLQSSGIIVVDKTSVITAAPTSVAVGATGSGRANGVFANNGGSSVGAGSVESNVGVLRNHSIQEWQPGENECANIHSTNPSQNLIRRGQKSISSSSVSGGQTLHQNSTKTATITTIPLANATQFNTNQMNQINHQQHLHHQQVQQQQQLSRQQQPQQHHHQTATVLQTAQSGQVIVSEEFLERATFSSNPNATGNANVINLTASDLMNSTQIYELVGGNGREMLIDSLGNVANGGHLHTNSKLLVGNLTVLSKQPSSGGSQPTFNFLPTKTISYLTTTKSQSPQPQAQPQIHHHITAAANNVQNGSGGATTSAMVQKVGVSRNVQVVTRMQTVTPSSPQPQQSPQPHQPATQPQTHLQHNVHNNQMIMQQKYVHNIVGTATNNINTKLNNNASGTLKKQVTTVNKITQQKTSISQGVKSHSHQQQSQQQQHHLIQHQQQQQQQQTQLQHATIKPVRSSKVVRKIVGSTGKNSTANTANTKYFMQSPIVLSNASNNQIMNTKIQKNSGNILLPQQIMSSINNSSCSTPNGGGAIKFVNAHGAVLQSHQTQPTIQSTVQSQQQVHVPSQQNQKTRCVSKSQQQSNQNQQPLQQQHYSQATTAVVTNEGILIPAYVSNSQAPSNGEEIMINGTQMTEEMSARILQSLSQNYNSMRQCQQPSQQQQVHQQPKIIQQQQPSSQAANVVFESSSPLSSREYPVCKAAIGVHQQQQQSAVGIQQPKIISTSNVVFEPSNREYGVCKTTTIQQHHTQQQYQSQNQQRIIQQQIPLSQSSLSSSSSGTNVVFEPPSSARIYPHLQQQQQQQHILQQQPHRAQQQIHQQQQQHSQQHSHSLSQRRTQSLDRKHGGGNQTSKRSTDYFKVKGDNAPATQQAEHEDDIIGEEVRPIPVSTHDARIQALHAVLQDHTYPPPQQQQQHQQVQQQQIATSIAQQQMHPSQLQPQIQQQAHTGGAIATTTITTISSSGVYNTSCIVGQQNVGNTNNATMQLTTTAGSLLTSSNLATFNYGQTAHHHNQRDDDANSVISNESRHGHEGLDNDLGEETETAPEAEAEDDSVTRCICDLTYDDGYMICCDKCSAWQHVDCMGIDRQNIPDEYLCEVCQPRPVDRTRAKSLQLQKRKEQTQLLLNAQMNAAANVSGTLIAEGGTQFLPTTNPGQERLQPLMVNTTNSGGNIMVGKKGKLVGGKKKELLKRVKKERSNSKRRDTKRTTKRKTKSVSSSNDTNSAEKQTQSLRQYIENYEQAMTNHYSPELRARLIAIGKQMPSFTEQKILRSANSEDKCTTVPHAGGKILISNLDIQPNSPIIELRGKYMLATQYKNQNPSINMNLQPPNGLQKNQKTPGPFIFFHKLSDDPTIPEICVDTRTYGNEARFVRRSCRPNAEIQHSVEKGTIHLWVVSLSNIMASTEITIRHEPHDVAALENKQFVVTPTSTMCACGLTKDCPFASCPPAPPSGIKTSNKKVVMNGACLPDGKQTQTPPVQGLVNASGAKKSLQNNVSRGRSTSSSGESNAGLLSPNSNFTSVYNIPSVSMMHDSGVYTSSSSPSVSIPSPTHAQTISSPPQHANNAVQKVSVLQTSEPAESAPTAIPLGGPSNVVNTAMPVKSPQKCNAQSRKTPVKTARNNSISEDSCSQTAPSLPTQTQTSQEEKRESRKLTREERKMEAIVRAIEKMEKNQQRKQELKQARNSSTGAGKRRNSSSPSPKRSKSQSMGEIMDSPVDSSQPFQTGQNSIQSVRKSSSGSVPRKKKRKSSKSYQIQSNQRKRRRSRINSNDSDMLTSEESSSLLSPPLARTTSLPASLPSPEEIAERQKCLVASLSLDSAQSTKQHLPPQRREEFPLPPLQPLQSLQTIPPPLQPIQHSLHPPTIHQQNTTDPQNVNNSQAAGLLLAFAANPDQEQNSASIGKAVEADLCKSPLRLPQQVIEQRIPQTPPIVSSTCMLVEAAVGPLEGLEMVGGSVNEFKLPAKTKTKKTIMNDWLNQSNGYQDYQQQQPLQYTLMEEDQHPQAVETYQRSSPSVQQPLQQQIVLQCQPESPQGGKGIDTLVQAAESINDFRQMASSPFSAAQPTEEPQNLSMVAKKVEEFIHQNDSSFVCSTEIKCEPTPVETHPNLMLPLHTINNNNNNCSGSSSVKKRWLRQAISEECSDELANLSASSPTQMCPTPNGFTTPLKKRRLIRECSEVDTAANSPEDLSMTKGIRDSNLTREDLSVTKTEVMDMEEMMKVKIKQEIPEAEVEVDIINSPSPDEKMITTDDNLVKIEPEDVSTEIKIDVEKEETSSSNDIVKKTDSLEQIVPVDVDKELKVESPNCTDPPSSSVLCPQPGHQIVTPVDVKLETNSPTVKTSPPPSPKIEKEVKEETASPPVVKTEFVQKEKCESISDEVSDEIADIQKRLHSFHTENIMILQSRNKSKIARSLKLEPTAKGDKKASVKVEVKTETASVGSATTAEGKVKKKVEKSRTTNVENEKRKKDNKKEGKHNKDSKKKKLGEMAKKVDEPKSKSNKKKQISVKVETVVKDVGNIKRSSSEMMEVKEIKVKNEVLKSEPPPLVPTQPLKEELKIDEKHLQAALTIPNFNRAVPTTSISNYVLQSVEQSYDISTLLAAPPPPPPPTLAGTDVAVSSTNMVANGSTIAQQNSSQPPPLHLPYYYNTIYGKPASSITSLSGSLSSLSSPSSNLLLSEYMDVAKAKSYSSLGGYISAFGLGLSKSTAGTVALPTVVTTTPTSTSDSTPSSTNTSSSGISSKILTKTASHDPRLNPILTAPDLPPAPRRKLSINEYRKRKQLTSESNSGTSDNANEKVSTSQISQSLSSLSCHSSLENGDKYDSTSNSNDESYSEKNTDVSKVQFSPAPTLLEQQQEILCERLKSFKNKSGVGLCSASSTLVGLKLESSLPSTTSILSSSTTTSSVDAPTSISNSPMEVNCFNLSTSDNRKDEFNLARRSLRNNSTSSLESISSASSSRSSSYRGTTPVPQQYDGMDSPRLALDDDNDVVNPTNHNTTEKTEKDVNTSTISDDPSTNPSAALSSSTSASSALKGSPVNDEATNNVRNNDENK
ncbi:unnamed protein product [Hermetia illucens]|uniref:Histone-lysine N-methyltransferase MLL5 n=1 Tax=Hermetia illucens TaxID=343691 RepID=A0A7R8UIW5_HERIL|nr:unnamed protein product [Hermetia illucens]